MSDETTWREAVRQKMESEINKRVMEALEIPPLPRLQRRKEAAKQQLECPDINQHLLLDARDRTREYLRGKRWRSLQENRLSQQVGNTFAGENREQFEELPCSNSELSSSQFRHDQEFNGLTDVRLRHHLSLNRFKDLQTNFHTKENFVKKLQAGSQFAEVEAAQDGGTFVDKYGVMRNSDGPFWPKESVPLFATPRFKWWTEVTPEPLHNFQSSTSSTVETQITQYTGSWRGILVVYDSQRSPRDPSPQPVPGGCCPSLMFESRFECGNLRQARRVGQFEYDLILNSDLYTDRHTQWYYFRVTNAVPGVTYKFRIINLLKKDSLYNHGMRPLKYSEHDAMEIQQGWTRTGHHISYSSNSTNQNCPLLERGVAYHTLEWQMEFSNANDTCYLAHCYPYSFTDLKEDLELVMNCEEKSKIIKREVMCETRAGNSCFLLTVTNFDSKEEKKAVVVTARVHPGESQSSWMMKGLLDFITGQDPAAHELRNKIVFKIVPMINPDGVIVGNYRCSLAGRDLNRNYRHPRRETFPTIWHVKNMVQDLAKKYEIVLYCDLHGHSRKPNVFMYGNNTSTDLASSPQEMARSPQNMVSSPQNMASSPHTMASFPHTLASSPQNMASFPQKMVSSPQNMARVFITERLFPWLMSVKSPEKFHFRSCKFRIRRCKEATGRVVMWRQMGVFNSFTMEATFSGTILDRENCRHFNIQDFMEMGKILAQAVLDYQVVMEDPVRYTQTVLGLTRAITEQVWMSRDLGQGILTSAKAHPGISTDGDITTQSSGEKSGSVSISGPSLAARRDAMSDEKERSLGQTKKRNKEETDLSSWTPSNESMAPFLQKLAGAGTIQDCVDLLAHLNVQDATQESTSSDSDSETEPEMKSRESKTRKKKRKSKKQRDKDNNRKVIPATGKTKVEDIRAQSALPNISATYLPGGNNSAPIHAESSLLWHSKQITSEKVRTVPSLPVFISKYEGRRNGGMPCFTEERCLERAAKRMEELQRKHSKENDGRSRGENFCQYPDEKEVIPPVTEEYLHHHQTPDSDDCPNTSSDSHLDSNVRTGYTHADNIYPDDVNSITLHRKSALSARNRYHGNTNHFLRNTDGIESTTDSKNFRMTSRRSPYNQPDVLHPHSASNVDLSQFSSVSHNFTSSSATAPLLASPSSSTTKIPHFSDPSTKMFVKNNFSSTLIINSLSNANCATVNSKLYPMSGISLDKSQDKGYNQKLQWNKSTENPLYLLRSIKDNETGKNDPTNFNGFVIQNKNADVTLTADDVSGSQNDIKSTKTMSVGLKHRAAFSQYTNGTGFGKFRNKPNDLGNFRNGFSNHGNSSGDVGNHRNGHVDQGREGTPSKLGQLGFHFEYNLPEVVSPVPISKMNSTRNDFHHSKTRANHHQGNEGPVKATRLVEGSRAGVMNSVMTKRADRTKF